MYASTCNSLFQAAEVVGKVFDLVDAEDLNESWLTENVQNSKTRP